MIVSVMLMGGLGNQLFQMAAAYGYARDHGRQCTIAANIQHSPHTNEHYENTLFQGFRIADEQQNAWYGEHMHHPTSYHPVPNFPHAHHVHIVGYFQHANYCKEYIKDFWKSLVLPDAGPLLENTCFIHVRRNDYVRVPFHFIDLAAYYVEAMDRVMQAHPEANFLVFSDDIAWCKEQAMFTRHGDKLKFCEEANEVKSLLMMTRCELGGICANSSFSWWGSYMNDSPKKMVFMPSRWFNDANIALDIAFEGASVLEV